MTFKIVKNRKGRSYNGPKKRETPIAKKNRKKKLVWGSVFFVAGAVMLRQLVGGAWRRGVAVPWEQVGGAKRSPLRDGSPGWNRPLYFFENVAGKNSHWQPHEPSVIRNLIITVS